NEALGYQGDWTVTVVPGKTATVPLELPDGMLHVNASPWADVWIDGKRVGETPLGNLRVPIGRHEILFRHPQLGEQRHAVTVSVSTPARLSVNLAK
ncbi:MAG: PEGA domain-containing protein, partial [Acidobacteria bacterium]|nr:PEGA domain-containing protein [Acidobacteriota bacterium]